MLVSSTNVEMKDIPIVTILLIFVNVAVFCKSYSMECMAARESQKQFTYQFYVESTESAQASHPKNDELNQFYQDWGFSMPDVTERSDFLSLFTHMFIHAGMFHILGNMVMLWAFGIALEEAFGSVFYGLFYLVCGLVAAFAQALMDMACDIPGIGASGAVAGVMGGFFVLYGWKAKVNILIMLNFMPRQVPCPAPVFALLWLGHQIFALTVTNSAESGVAWMAHLGGIAAGAGIAFMMRGKLKGVIETNDDGMLQVTQHSKNVLTEQQILEQVLEMQPVNVVVDTLLGDDAEVLCTECNATLDMQNLMSGRLARCTGCGKVAYVDAELLLRGRDLSTLNF